MFVASGIGACCATSAIPSSPGVGSWRYSTTRAIPDATFSDVSGVHAVALVAEDQGAQIDGLIMMRGPELKEFGATIRYLWEARSVTGQMIAIDGGQHLAWQTPDVTGMAE